MKQITRKKARLYFLVLMTMAGSSLLTFNLSHADPLEKLRSVLPRQIGQWSAVSPDRLFDEETIFDYIDGAGEVYRAYNMRSCLSRRYTRGGGPEIVLDIFDMRSSEDAYGVFTHDQDGEALEVGQGGLYRSGWLSFWKDRFFVSIYMEAESSAAQEAVRQLAKEVASLIPGEGPRPQILALLPREGLQRRTLRYLHNYLLLNYHFYVADENLLNLGPDTQAALAQYKRTTGNARFLVVRYASREKALKAYGDFLSAYLPEASSRTAVRLENGKWAAAVLKGRLLAIVLEADSGQLAEGLIKETTDRD